jgi:hypothetical protein
MKSKWNIVTLRSQILLCYLLFSTGSVITAQLIEIIELNTASISCKNLLSGRFDSKIGKLVETHANFWFNIITEEST